MINCLIVDDEPIALDILESYVKKTPFLNLKARCLGVNEAWKAIESGDVNLIFLDIQMPQINGLEFSKVISQDIKIIFTTAFGQYALEGFKVNALDYLLKPFDYTEFLTAALRAKDWFELKAKPDKEEVTSAAVAEDSLLIKSEYKLVRIRIPEIDYVEGMKDYAKFYVAGKKDPIFSLMSLKSLEEKLANWPFMRIHRSYIINLDKIEIIERNEIVVAGASVPLADKYKEQFQNYIQRKFR